MNPDLILNVDDQEINRYIRREVLEQAGYRVLEAGDGRSALECCAAVPPDLVLLDMNLPDMSGLEVCRSLRKMDPKGHIVIVHISAKSTNTRDRVEGLHNGAHAYLTEPVEPSLLVATVHSLLDLRNTGESGGRAGPRESIAAAQMWEDASGCPTDYRLTVREREVLTLMAAGHSTKELAYDLGITFKTAACHRARILKKFGAHNAAEVVRLAIAAGLLTV